MNASILRPKAVTIISWLIIAKGALLFFPTLLLVVPSVGVTAFEEFRSHGLSLTFHIAWSILGALVRWVAGFLMLRGVSSGRLLYVVYVPCAFVVSIALLGVYPRDAVGAVVFIVFTILLFRQPAAGFFRPTIKSNATGNA